MLNTMRPVTVGSRVTRYYPTRFANPDSSHRCPRQVQQDTPGFARLLAAKRHGLRLIVGTIRGYFRCAPVKQRLLFLAEKIIAITADAGIRDPPFVKSPALYRNPELPGRHTD